MYDTRECTPEDLLQSYNCKSLLDIRVIIVNVLDYIFFSFLPVTSDCS
uniref:Uncharacterized protein n=1 Tax=Lepeophtheirus salmonis TaxID=72036 RepID=A0A0K2UH02_LEPSM